MKTQLQLSNLVDDGNEYQFVLCVSQKEKPVYYYSRIIYLTDEHTEKPRLVFAHDFWAGIN